jgi:hypothetical protein
MIFFLLSFLRWDRGADWMSYYDYFLNFTKPDEGMFFEFGYQYLSCFIRNVFNNYTILLFVQSLIIYFSFLITIRNFSLNPVFSLLIFFSIIFADIYFVRQNVAIAITFFSFNYIYKKRILVFILFVLLASSIHVTSIIFILAYPIYYLRLSRKSLFVLFICFIGSIFFIEPLLIYFSNSFDSIVSFKIARYIALAEDPAKTGANDGVTLIDLLIKGMISRFVILIAILGLLNTLRMNNKLLNGISNFYIFGCFCYFSLAPLGIAFARVVNYYEIFIILIIPYLFRTLTSKRIKLLMLIFVISYCSIRFISGYNRHPTLYSPYKSIFYK